MKLHEMKAFESDFPSFYRYHYTYAEKIKMLTPVIEHIKTVDQAKNDLYENTISLNKLREYRNLLTRVVKIEGNYGESTFSLTNHSTMNRLAFSLGLFDISIQVRRDRKGFPEYLLCEFTENYDGGYGLVLAEYYRSRDYERGDERFVKLMTNGHEMSFLQMSGFRKDLSLVPGISEAKTDELLRTLGDIYLQGAWHEDQFVSFVVADYFAIPVLKDIIEVLYVILSSDLSTIRNNYNQSVKKFFSDVYPRKSPGILFDRIGHSSAAGFLELEEKARDWYLHLNGCFTAFLSTPVYFKGCYTPLYKLIYSNIYRMHLLSDLLTGIPAVQKSLKILKETSEEALRDITEAA